MVGLALLAEARAANLELAADGDRLVIRGPRSCEPLAKKLLEHKKEILELLKQEESNSHAGPSLDDPASQSSECEPPMQTPESSDSLDGLRMKRDRLSARLEKGCHFLDDLAHRAGQESAEYDRYFSIWLRILRDYERTCDEITVLQARQEFSAWHARRTAARASHHRERDGARLPGQRTAPASLPESSRRCSESR